MKLIYLLGIVVLGIASTVYGRSSGPPDNIDGVCVNLMPGHGVTSQPEGENGGYLLTANIPFNETEQLFSYTAGTTYNVQVQGTINPVAGFLVQARAPSGDRIGTFTPSSGQRIVDCTGVTPSQPMDSSIGHSASTRQMTEFFTWTAPTGTDGSVDFMYTVVQQFSIIFVGLSAAAQVVPATNETTTTMLPGPVTTVAGLGALPVGTTQPVRGAEDYRITARSPDGCLPSICDIFVGIDTNAGNSDVLDVYIEGNAQAWVAVGFSQSASMFDTDVLGCSMNPNTNIVEVLDTWNPSSPARGNLPDQVSDVGTYTTNSQNGRISCSFGRTIAGSDVPNTDLRLDEPHFIIFGVGPSNPSLGSLSIHQTGPGNPIISPGMINPAAATMSIGGDPSLLTRSNLTRAHGILMIIAWPLLAVIAIFFAAWMRPALPNGEWFQVHRAFMIASLVVGLIGFFLIFVAQYRRRPIPGLINLGVGNEGNTAHFAIGILVMLLQIANPLIALCRCGPGKPNRWIFNLIHGSVIGLGAEILALINVGIGISLFSRGFSIFQNLTVFYVYLGWLVFFVATIAILFVLFTVLAFTSDEDGRSKLAPSLIKPLVKEERSTGGGGGGVELTVPGQKPSEPAADEPKPPSRDAPIRWTALVLFTSVTLIAMIILIILVAI